MCVSITAPKTILSPSSQTLITRQVANSHSPKWLAPVIRVGKPHSASQTTSYMLLLHGLQLNHNKHLKGLQLLVDSTGQS